MTYSLAYPPNQALMKKESTEQPTQTMRAVFTQGGKGGVGKTEVAIALASWYRANGI